MVRIYAAILMCVLPVTVGAATRDDVHTFTLDNGLEGVVIVDKRAPVVTNMVWYRVGSADEPPGKSGIAHFLEHLMFKGTDEVAPGEFGKIIADNGGQDNAFTSYDYTGYFQRVASDRLELMIRLEADRMRDLVLTDDVVDPERGVILEERNQRVDSDPGALFGEQRRAAQYLNHPYGRPIIGWRHEMEGLTREDALAFYERYYAPNNAILIVAGDVDPAQVKTLATIYFGALEPSELPPRIRPTEPPQLAPRRITYSDPKVGSPYVVRTYLAPSRKAGDQKEAAALAILSDLLSDGVTSHFKQVLEFEEQVAVNSGAFYSPTGLDDQNFGVFIVPTADVSLEEAELRMDAAIASFLEEGPDPAHMARVKNQIRAAQIYALDDQQGRARSYGAALTSGLTVTDVQEWPDVLDAVTEADVMAAAQAVFDLNKSVTGYLQQPEPEVTE